MTDTSAVPGTIHLVDDHELQADIVLHPTPTRDPQDPLNWPKWRKHAAIGTVYIYVLAIGIAATCQYSILTQIAASTTITVAELNTGTGLMFLFLGWGCLIWQPIALTYGRRGVYIISALLSIGPMIWTIYSSSPGVWYAHRIILGILASPVESLPEVSVPDLFFAHERGTYMAIYTFVLFGSNFLAPFMAGFIYDAMGWHAVIWFGTIVLACATVLLFFTMEETMYFRSTVEGVDDSVIESVAVSHQTRNEMSEKAKEAGQSGDIAITNASSRSQSPIQGTFMPERTYLQKLNLFVAWPNRPTPKEHLTMMWRPLVIFFRFPNVTWAGFLYGTNLSWYNVLNATMSLILTAKPYNFKASMVGTAYLAPSIGAALACVFAGWFGDKVALYFARRNGGVREPEHRLWTLAFSGLMATSGLILWGVGAAKGVHFMGLMFGIGIMAFGLVCNSSTSLAYTVDCFKDIAGETMIIVIIIRNTLGFGFSYAITPWISAQGLEKTFVAVGMISLFFTGTFVAMIVWGKRLRKFSAKTYYDYAATTMAGH
ncbi:MFS general substrate transporter-1 [Venturia nashicola]|nr:MFS general substrate transporter-1 [Venturia nashicola]